MKERMKILIADDSAMNRELLSDMLSDEYVVDEVADGREAIERLNGHVYEYSLILLDIVMPKLDGYAVLAHMNNRGWINHVPVIMISADGSGENIGRAFRLGAADFINRPFDSVTVKHRAYNMIKLYARQRMMEAMAAEKIAENDRQSNLMTSILSHIVEFRNGESGPHVLNVKTITTLLLHELAEMGRLPEELIRDITIISDAAAIHDIGKISLPTEVINKPGRLTDEEFEIIKTHAKIGADMLDNLPVGREETLVKYAYDICRWHHERIDGRGYPDGLKGDEIPIHAQIVAIADVYDALTADRCYRLAFSHEVAMDMIKSGKCGAFSEDILECLERISPKLSLLDSGEVYDAELVRVQELGFVPARFAELTKAEGVMRTAEADHVKYQFLLDSSDRAVFIYHDDPSILSFSARACRLLGTKEAILDPLDSPDELPRGIAPELLLQAIALSKAATPDEPDFSIEIPNPVDPSSAVTLLCRTVWISGNKEYFGFIGKAVPKTRS